MSGRAEGPATALIGELITEAHAILADRLPLPNGARIQEARVWADLAKSTACLELWGRVRWRWVLAQREAARRAAKADGGQP